MEDIKRTNMSEEESSVCNLCGLCSNVLVELEDIKFIRCDCGNFIRQV